MQPINKIFKVPISPFSTTSLIYNLLTVEKKGNYSEEPSPLRYFIGQVWWIDFDNCPFKTNSFLSEIGIKFIIEF
jgi:hypothetical protein